MTRSDLIIEVCRRNDRMVNPPDELVTKMHKKIEAVYSILFQMEAVESKDALTHLTRELAEVLRKALES